MTDLIINIPVHNEEERLPELFDSIQRAQKNYHIELVLVNHLSTDNSIGIINSIRSKFYKVNVINEMFPLACGGKPRNTGFGVAIKLADKYLSETGKRIPIATLDCDTQVSDNFIEDAMKKLASGYDIVTFPERYNQNILFNWIKMQDVSFQENATKALIGLNWFRYELLWGLILKGIKETRGPGGYVMSSNTLNMLGHLQPLDKNGKPVTGENNRLGILANRMDLKVYCSPFYSTVHPRREISSYSRKNIQEKGYSLNEFGSEVFKLARPVNDYPKLNAKEWDESLVKGVSRALKMSATRIACYKKFDEFSELFPNISWKKLVTACKKYIDSNNFDEDELSVTDSYIYRNMIDFATESIGKDNFSNLILEIISYIPDNEYLKSWATDNSATIQPTNCIIKDLQIKYINEYENRKS